MVVLTPTERQLYTTRLTEAREALHQLNIGQQARVFVDQNGERVEFTPSTVSRLSAYIAELERLLGISGKAVGPLRFLW